MWSGLGVNYKSKQTNWASDAEYFERIGLTTIRPHLSNFPVGTYTPNSEVAIEGSIDWWRTCSQYFKNQGFTVIHGPASSPSSPFTSTVWTDYRAKVLQDAAYNQSIGLALDVYQIGNEIEGDIDNTTLTQTQLITNLKALATDVKAVYPLATKIGYSCYDSGSTMFNNFISAGLGDIDVLSANVYAQTTASGKGFIFGDMSKLGLMIKTFGADRFTLSEFGITGNSSEYTATPRYNRNYITRHIYAGIRELGFTQAIAYSYVGYLDGDNQFALKNTDGTFDVQWGVLLADGGFSTIDENGDPIAYPVASGSYPVLTGNLTLKTPSDYPVFFDAKGNMQDNRVTPVNVEPMRIDADDDFTVAVKLKLKKKTAQSNSTAHTIMRNDFSFGNDKGYLVQVFASDGSLRLWSGATAQTTASGLFTYDTDVWFAVRITGTTAKFYLDGVQVGGDLAIARKADNATSNMWFLTESGGATSSVNGVFGEVYEIVYAKSLLSEAALVALTTGTYPTCDIRYKFTRGAGRWVADLSGNNNHGLLQIEKWGRHS